MKAVGQKAPSQKAAPVFDLTVEQTMAATDAEIQAGVRLVLDNAPEGCFMAAVDGSYEFVNRPWCDLVGIAAGDALGAGWHATIHPEDCERVEKNWHDAVARGLEFAMEYRLDVGGILPRWVAVTARPVVDTAGVATGYLGWVSDVTKKVELEKYLERALMSQVKVTEQSRRQEERFRLIIENMSEGIWQFDADHRTVFCNQRMAQLLGCTVDDLMGRLLVDVLVEAGECVDALLRSSAPGVRSLQEVTLRREDGSAVVVTLAASALGLEGRSYGGSLVIVSDLSDLRETEGRLHTIERQFETVFERAPIGITMVDTEGDIIEANEAALRMSGYEHDELVGTSSANLLSDEDQERTTRAVAQDLVDNHSPHVAIEHRLHRKDGDERWVRSDISLVQDDAGELLFSLILSTDITEKRVFEEHLVHEASHDHLTGLPNRALMRELLEQAAARTHRHHRSMAVMFVDLDHFKEVNDKLGHAAGDDVLTQASHRISGALRLGDVVARYGGDEFVVVCEDAGSHAGATVIADRIRHALTMPFILETGQAKIGASIGIVLSDGSDDIDSLLEHADQGLYRAKRDGRNRSVLYDTADELAR